MILVLLLFTGMGGALVGLLIQLAWLSAAGLFGFAPPTDAQAQGLVGLGFVIGSLGVGIIIGAAILYEELRP